MNAGAFNVVYTLFDCLEIDSSRKFLDSLEQLKIPDYAGTLRKVKLSVINSNENFWPINWCAYQVVGLF